MARKYQHRRDEADCAKRLRAAHKSLAGMSAYAGTLLERISALETQVENHQRTIACLKQSLDDAEVAIIRAAASDIGVSFTGSSTPIQKSTERQPNESLPTQERQVRASQSQPRETPGNEQVVDPANPPASWSLAENTR
jgi:hypothetical protein